LKQDPSKLRVVGEGNSDILNVLGKDTMKGGRYLKDRLDVSFSDDSHMYFKEIDLAIGRTINVFGRCVVLTDCDDFTKAFYRKKYGVEEFHPIAVPERSQKYFSRCSGENNGWGSFEDSEGNCMGIEVRAPKIDFNKFLNYDK